MSDAHDSPDDVSDDEPQLGAEVERLLGKHLLGSATPAEEVELRALAEREPGVAAALEVLERSAAAFRDSPLAQDGQPNPSEELSALLADRERALAILAERAQHTRRARLTSFAWGVFFLGVILWKAAQEGWGWATWAAPEWWWIPGLVGFGVLHQLLHLLATRQRRERLAAGGEDWSELVARARRPLGWGGVIKICSPTLVLVAFALAIGYAEPPLLLSGLHVGWRQVIALVLAYLATVPLWRLHPYLDATWLRVRAEQRAQGGAA